jgi:hypothetical protein
VDRPSGLLVNSRSDHDEGRTGEIIEITVADFEHRRQQNAVADIGRNGLGAFARAIHQHDLRGRAAENESKCARSADRFRPDNSNLHS